MTSPSPSPSRVPGPSNLPTQQPSTPTPKIPSQGINVTIPYSPTDSMAYYGNPLTTINAEDIQYSLDKNFLIPGTCHLRRTYSMNRAMEARRQILLQVGIKLVDNPNRLPSVPLPLEAEDIAMDALVQLDSLLFGIPFMHDNIEEIGYHLDPVKFDNFNYLLKRYVKRAQKRIPDTLFIPIWGLDDYPLDVWSANDFEVLSVLYRDDVETFLAYLFHNNALIPSKSKEKITASQIQTEGITPMIHQRRQEPESFYHTATEIQPPHSNHSNQRLLPRPSTIHEEQGFQESRRLQAQKQFEPRPTNMSYVPHPIHISTSRRISELFQEPNYNSQSSAPRPQNRAEAGPPGNPGDSSDSDSNPTGPPNVPPPNLFRGPSRRNGNDGDSDPPGPPGGRGFGTGPWRGGRGRGGRGFNVLNRNLTNPVNPPSEKEAQFDLKLKPEIVPKWDGDPDTLARWIIKINNLAERSTKLYDQLGDIVPTRLEKEADSWFWSLPLDYRRSITQNWGSLRTAIGSYYMNRPWLDKQKSRANKSHYREPGHSQESPTAYFIRKSELLNLVYSYSDSEIMMEVMEGAPKFWATILDPHRCKNLIEFAEAIKYHEDALQTTQFLSDNTLERRIRNLEQSLRPQPTSNSRFPSSSNRFKTRANLIGYTPSLGKPPFPKDDSIVSKGTTPEKKGARPCRHCGSGKHWDNECKHARKGARNVRANFANPSPEYLEAMEEYEEAYINATSDEEESHAYIEELPSGSPGLPEDENKEDSRAYSAMTMKIESNLRGSVSLSKYSKNLEEKRRLLNGIFKASNFIGNVYKSISKEILALPKLMARPPGCSFLGAQATSALAWIGQYGLNQSKVVIDSGADITLISHALHSQLKDSPRIKMGQKINLIQVTGTSTISGFITLPIYFDTNQGPIELLVEAYVVKGMTTPFILGNDFADQYAISIIRNDQGSSLVFGDSGYSMEVQNSLGTGLVEENGRAFTIKVEENPSSNFTLKQRDNSVRALFPLIIPPQSCSSIPVKLNFPKGCDYAYIEKVFISNRGEEDFYAIPDSLISKDSPKLYVSNFSSFPVHIHEGQVLGYSHNPNNWLTQPKDLSQEKYAEICSHSLLVKSLFDTLGKTPTLDDSEGQEEAQGGPKLAEVPPEDIPSSQLLREVDIPKDLTPLQRSQLEQVIFRNQDAFGLNGRLGHHPAKVEIPLREGTKEISMPPFFASPRSRQVIDEQMDKWIKLKVIEPSKSPWGAPAFIVYKQAKPRMVIDFRKLNESVIPDEFPLPRQEDILKSLTGSQWLSTLDALAGFTQLEIAEKDREKTAFRTHRGLYQFLRMPFGFRNGPAVFQRVMQNVLAPYLWIFTLVYIDDIVIYSKTFEDHLKHVDLVLKAIIQSKITLSPEKCHFAYQSLKLLGQKVSRLGLSTYKEKVDAILQLVEPKNIHELQVFLGMMVYFAAYIPYYAWIVNPLFLLLKKKTPWIWEEPQERAFELAKKALTSAPVRAFPIAGLGYRLYTDACDIGIAAILQQVQPIRVKDLKETKIYKKLEVAYHAQGPVPNLIAPVSKEEIIPTNKGWSEIFDDTIVHVERVIGYWSRTLKPAERNYSPTEREALALKDGLIKFQAYIDGEKIFAITDHAALTWSKTYQNINRRLLTWGTIFAAYPELRIVHRAGRVHSNVDPISRLKRRFPEEQGPVSDPTRTLGWTIVENDPLASLTNELGTSFKTELLSVCAENVSSGIKPSDESVQIELEVENKDLGCVSLNYATTHAYSIVIGVDAKEIQRFVDGYSTDPHFSKVSSSLKVEENWENPAFPQYYLGDEGLIFFEDSLGRNRFLYEGAHGGYHRTYNRIATGYYWPRMSRDVLKYVRTCDICQKTKPRKHSPFGLLQSIAIPSQPFEVITMDFIMDLPDSNGFNAILVVVDKLTKFVIVMPCNTTVNEEETAELLFKNVFKTFGLPRQIISDRDARWTSRFWEGLCRQLGIRRGLSTAYHPQSDGQTENLNQTLEVCLRAYVGPDRNDWTGYLDGFTFAYNTTIHTVTGFSPSFLLFGFEPVSRSRYLSPGIDHVKRSLDKIMFGDNKETTNLLRDDSGWNSDENRASTSSKTKEVLNEINAENADVGLDERVDKKLEDFKANRERAMDSLLLGQIFQRKYYNAHRMLKEFEVGDKVLINQRKTGLLRNVKGRGEKLLILYEGPFEITQKISKVAYRLRMPASYGIHPVINIAHLEPYEESPPEFGTRQNKRAIRKDFEDLPEYEVEQIIDERLSKVRNGKKQRLFLTRFVGYGPESDEWLTKTQLKNAPEILSNWEKERRQRSARVSVLA